MKCVILESPFAGPTAADVAAHVAYARACMRILLREGMAPYASCLLYTQEGVLNDRDPAERKLGMEAGFAWHRLAEASVVAVDLGISDGMRAGIARSEEHGIPVVERRFVPNEDHKVRCPLPYLGLPPSRGRLVRWEGTPYEIVRWAPGRIRLRGGFPGSIDYFREFDVFVPREAPDRLTVQDLTFGAYTRRRCVLVRHAKGWDIVDTERTEPDLDPFRPLPTIPAPGAPVTPWTPRAP